MSDTNAGAMSIVRSNMLSRSGYTPYCGSEKCTHGWPRSKFNGSQFECGCGWKSTFEPEFIERYKQVKP